jgi:small-conductance mechanosensitive channel
MDWDDAIDFVVKALGHLAAGAAVLVGGYLLARAAQVIVRRLLQRHETVLGPSVVRLATRLRVLPTVAPDDYWTVRSELREQIKARLNAEGLRFAVPPRDVTVRQS